jgi:hypothetical protein
MITAEGRLADRLGVHAGAGADASAQNSWTPLGPQPAGNTAFYGNVSGRVTALAVAAIAVDSVCVFGEHCARTGMAWVGDGFRNGGFRFGDEFRNAPAGDDCHLLRGRIALLNMMAACGGSGGGGRWRQSWADVCHHHHGDQWKLSALDLGATRGKLALLETPSRRLIEPGRFYLREVHRHDLPAVP